jgi:hypothetical protein
MTFLKKDGWTGQVSGVVVSIYAERLRKFAGSVRELNVTRRVSVGPHAVKTFDRLDGTDKNGTADALTLCDHIQQPVSTVDEVHVRGRGRFE